MAETQSTLDILRQKAEAAVNDKATTTGGEMKRDAGGLLHQLQIYQVELEMQVDELQLSSKALETQTNKFKLLFDLAPVSYLVVDKHGIIADINKAGVALLDIGGKSMALNKPFAAFIAPGEVDTFYLFLRDLFHGAEGQRRALNFISKQRETICAQVSGVVFKELGTEPVCYLVLTDISELQQAKLNLGTAKRKLEIALDASMTGTWEVDTANGHIFLDDFCQSIFEFGSFDFDNRIETILRRIHPDDRQAFESELRGAIVCNSTFALEFRVQADAVAPLKYIQARAGMAEPKQFIGTMIDFTEKRQMEEESAQLKGTQEKKILAAAIKAEEKEKKRISEALHDGVAQQLYALKLSLDALKNTVGSDYYQFDKLLNNTISDLRDISFELTPAILTDFGLNEALREMANRLFGQNLKISLNLTPNLKDLEIDFQLCIYRIIQELVNNSIRHGKAGQVSVDVDQINGNIMITVTDNGAGFEVKKNSKHLQGMGLASIRNRLKLYSGTLDIKSKINKGTRVSIILKQFS